MLLKLAEVLHTSVNEILGLPESGAVRTLEEALAQANALLEEQARREQQLRKINQKRGGMLTLCFLAMLAALLFQNPIVSACLMGLCFVAAVAVLYRNLGLLTGAEAGEGQRRALKVTTIFNATLLVCCVAVAVLMEAGVIMLPQALEKVFAALILAAVIIFSGLIAPRLPFNRYTGLRLPWTVRDEETWCVAHRILSLTAVPIAVLYLTGVLVFDCMEVVSAAAVAVWIGLPALLSLVFYEQKMHGRR